MRAHTRAQTHTYTFPALKKKKKNMLLVIPTWFPVHDTQETWLDGH